MSDIEGEIRKAVTQPQGDARQRDDDFARLRAHVRGTLIMAHRTLATNEEWMIIDDRILDTVTNWLESKRR